MAMTLAERAAESFAIRLPGHQQAACATRKRHPRSSFTVFIVWLCSSSSIRKVCIHPVGCASAVARRESLGSSLAFTGVMPWVP